MSHDDCLIDAVDCAPECVLFTAAIFDFEASLCVVHDTVVGNAAVVSAEVGYG